MATAELLIAFDARIGNLETSLKRVTQSLKDMKNTTDQTVKDIDSSLGGLGGAFNRLTSTVRGFIGIWAGMQGLRFAKDVTLSVDDLNSSIRRLGALTNTTLAGAVDQFNRLQQIAARTGQPVTDLVNSFQRFYTATASIGASRVEVERFVNTLAGFAQISGQKPQEAAAAITQLAQGLASGRLQGDELKSILENMPQLAVALARELNTSVGALRQMGEEGKLTAENVFPALIRAGNNLNNQLRNLPLSLRQAWQGALDSALSFIATVDRRIGASEFLSQLLQAAGSGFRAAQSRVAGTGEGASTEDRLANIGRQADVARTNIARLRGELERIDERGGARVAAPGSLFSPRQAGRSREVVEQELQAQERILQGHLARQRQIEVQEAELTEADRVERARNATAQQIANGQARLREIREEANPEQKALREHQERLTFIEQHYAAERAQNARTNARTDQQIEADRQAARAASLRTYNEDLRKAGSDERAAAARAQAERDQVARANQQLSERNRRELEQNIRTIVQAGDTGLEGLRHRIEQWQQAVGGADRTNAFNEFFTRAGRGMADLTIGINALTSSYESAAVNIVRSGGSVAEAQQYMARVMEQARAAFVAAGGSVDEFNRIWTEKMARVQVAIDKATGKIQGSFQDIARQGVKTFADDLSGAIIDFATTGEQKFDEMAANFAKNMAKMILQLLIFRALVQSLSAIPGMGWIAQGRQAGGPVTAGSPYIVGEAGPELFVPGASGTIVPNHAMGGGEVTVNVYNNSSGTTTRQQERRNSLGGKEIDIYIEDVVRRGMTTGRFDDALGQSFGASRVGRV